MAAGLIASPVEWQLLKGFLNCTQVDGWLSGGQWTENFERGGGGQAHRESRKDSDPDTKVYRKRNVFNPEKKEVFKLKAVKKC